MVYRRDSLHLRYFWVYSTDCDLIFIIYYLTTSYKREGLSKRFDTFMLQALFFQNGRVQHVFNHMKPLAWRDSKWLYHFLDATCHSHRSGTVRLNTPLGYRVPLIQVVEKWMIECYSSD